MDSEKTIEYFKHLEQYYGSYHDHKETMVNAGILVQIGLFGAVITSNPAASIEAIDVGFLGVQLSGKFLAIVVYLGFWASIHAYVRWQLDKRAIAAILVKHMRIELLSWIDTPPEDNDLVPYGGAAGRKDDRSIGAGGDARVDSPDGKTDNGEGVQSSDTEGDGNDKSSLARSIGDAARQTGKWVVGLFSGFFGFLAYLSPFRHPRPETDAGIEGFPASMAKRIRADFDKRQTGVTQMERRLLWSSLLLGLTAVLFIYSSETPIAQSYPFAVNEWPQSVRHPG